MLTRSHRRRTALALGSLTLVLSSLTGCGLSAATNRPYTPAAGAVETDSTVKVTGAVVVSAEEGSGTFIANLANSDQSEGVSFDGLADVTGTATAEEFAPMEIGPGGMLNLAETGGVVVTGEFVAGDSLDLTLGFSDGSQVDITVFVVDDEGFYAGLDSSGTATLEPGVEDEDASVEVPESSETETDSETGE